MKRDVGMAWRATLHLVVDIAAVMDVVAVDERVVRHLAVKRVESPQHLVVVESREARLAGHPLAVTHWVLVDSTAARLEAIAVTRGSACNRTSLGCS